MTAGWGCAERHSRSLISYLRCRCECKLDGMGGDYCEVPLEQTCINQCSGRGTCYLGFCKCFDGWYGHACQRRSLHHSSHKGMHGRESLPPFLTPCGILSLPPYSCVGQHVGHTAAIEWAISLCMR